MEILKERKERGWRKRKGIMLCYPFEEKRLAKWEPPYIVQPKLDGERCRAIFQEDGSVLLLSSEENVITGVPHIKNELEKYGYRNLELDGELYRHGMPFSEIHSIVSRGEDNLREDYELIQFHIFDLVNEKPQILRSRSLLDFPESQFVRVVYTEIVGTLDEIIRSVESFTSWGYEGIVIRNINAPYMRKRSIWMMKWKPRRSDDYLVVDYTEEIDKNGKPKGSLGALICIGNDGELFRVGSGFTKEQREKLWEKREKLKGKTIRVLYQNLTHKRGVPRNGVFSCFVERID